MHRYLTIGYFWRRLTHGCIFHYQPTVIVLCCFLAGGDGVSALWGFSYPSTSKMNIIRYSSLSLKHWHSCTLHETYTKCVQVDSTSVLSNCVHVTSLPHKEISSDWISPPTHCCLFIILFLLVEKKQYYCCIRNKKVFCGSIGGCVNLPQVNTWVCVCWSWGLYVWRY